MHYICAFLHWKCIGAIGFCYKTCVIFCVVHFIFYCFIAILNSVKCNYIHLFGITHSLLFLCLNEQLTFCISKGSSNGPNILGQPFRATGSSSSHTHPPQLFEDKRSACLLNQTIC